MINKKSINNFLLLNLGVFLAALSFTLFLTPNSITGSGLSGLAIIVEGFLPSFLSIEVFIFICNAVLLTIAFFLMGKSYFTKTAYGALSYPIYQLLINLVLKCFDSNFFEVDMYLAILFGALLMGVGVGLTLRAGGSTGGGDIIQSIFFKYFNIPFSKTMYVIDGLLVVGCLLVFKDFSLMLSSIIYIVITGIVVDMIVFGALNKRAVYIISEKNDEIRELIKTKLIRGTTNLLGYGGYDKKSREVILCVLSSNEYFELRKNIEIIDPQAFMFATRSTEVRGYGFSLISEARMQKKKNK